MHLRPVCVFVQRKKSVSALVFVSYCEVLGCEEGTGSARGNKKVRKNHPGGIGEERQRDGKTE